MGPEFWVGLAAVFVSGGAIGAAGTLLSQWLVRKLSDPGPGSTGRELRETDLLRGEVADLSRQIQNLDARLDFQEQLLGGSTPTTQPPPRLALSEQDEV
jgi:hypothetical protein